MQRNFLSFFFLLNLFSSSFSPLKATQAEISELRDQIRIISQRVQEQSDQHLNAKSIIILGPTGSGKSTLVNLLAGKLFTAQQSNIGFKVHTDDCLPGFNIGDGNIVGTRFPSAWFDHQNNTIFWDCPGFADPRGPKSDIINAFSIYQLFKPTTKMVLTIQEQHLILDRATGFLKILKDLTNLFPDNQQINQSLAIIVSKQQNAHNIPGYLEHQILPLTQQDQLELTPSVRNLLQFLVAHPERISSFPYPNGLGVYNPNMDIVRQSINATNYIENPRPHIRVSGDALLYVDSLGKSLNYYISKHMKNNGHITMIDYCNSLMSNQSDPTLIDRFKCLERDLRDIQNIVVPQNPNLFPERLKAIFGNNFNVEEIKTTIENIGFLRTIRDSITYNTADWIHALLPTIGRIQELTSNLEKIRDIQELKNSFALLRQENEQLKKRLKTAITYQEFENLQNTFTLLRQEVNTRYKAAEVLEGTYSNIGYNKWISFNGLYKPLTFSRFSGNEKLRGDLSSMNITEDGTYYLAAHYHWKANPIGTAICSTFLSINNIDNHEGCNKTHNLSPNYVDSGALTSVRYLKKGDRVILFINGHENGEYFPDWFNLIVRKIV